MQTGAHSTVAALRHRIERLETVCAPGAGRTPELTGGTGGLTLGFEPVDTLLPLGRAGLGVHQVAPAQPGDPMAAHGFVTSLLARAMRLAPGAQALIVRDPGAVREVGPCYPPGLHAMGLDPARLAFASAPSGAAALRIADEALRTAAVKFLVLELWDGAGMADLRVTRRFNLAARRAGALMLLSTPDLRATSAALTRWRISSLPSRGRRRFLGPPAFQVELVRNRMGPTGAWRFAWTIDEHVFVPHEPMAAPVVRAPFHRPYPADAPADDCAVWAYRQTG